MLTVREAQQKILDKGRSFGTESVMLKEAYGRVIAEDAIADRNYPPFNRATMDGFAINYKDYLEKGIRNFKVVEEVFAGKMSSVVVKEGECIKIMTGAPVPKSLDVVIKVEDTSSNGNSIQVQEINLFTNLNIALEGEDTLRGQVIVKKNTLISPAEVSSLAVIGKKEISVYKLPTVAVISTGNEIKSLKEEVEIHQIRDSNSFAIEAFLSKYKIPLSFRKIAQDDEEELYHALKEARNFDIVITSGGVSMGDADFMPAVFRRVGIQQVFHKVQVKPGKPIWFGVSDETTVFGLPGNPVSVQVACKIFVEPYLRACFGLPPIARFKLPLIEPKEKKTKFDEFFPCRLSTAEITGLSINKFNGSGDITATLSSDGVGLHEASKGDLEKGEVIDFFPWNF